MKKIIFLSFFAFLSTSVLFAQTKELTKTADSQTLQVSKNGTLLTMLKMQDREMNTAERVQIGSQDSEVSMMKSYEASKANKDLAMEKRLMENEAKSKLAREKRDELTKLVLLRLKKTNSPVLNRTSSN
jgi:hypothetical protein